MSELAGRLQWMHEVKDVIHLIKERAASTMPDYA